MGKYEREFTQLLKTSTGERAVHAYLKKHSDLVLRAFNTAWNCKHVLSEFKVGTNFRSDFLILSADSGSWHAIFLELESHRARLYSPDGRPTKTLQIAERQLAEWRDYVRQYENVLRHQFSEILRSRKDCSQCSVAGMFGSAAEEIRDSRTVVHYDYHVVIGRSRYLSADEQRHRQQDCQHWGGMAIATYDRLLHFARTTDAAYHREVQDWKKSGSKMPSAIRRHYYGSRPALIV
jgi:hypothetical protein